MLKQVVVWWESIDGKRFLNEEDCMKHELQILYERSGYRFYKDKKVLENFPENIDIVGSYDYCTVDKSKVNQNKEFINCCKEWYGYLIDEWLEEDKCKYYV